MTDRQVIVVDYGMGNIGSLLKMIRRFENNTLVSNHPTDIENSSHIVLPGVGAFDKAIEKIESVDGLRETLVEKVTHQATPILGVCLGMQLLLDSSEEGHGVGFGWISGHVKRLQNSSKYRVPHMGWNSITLHKTDPLLAGLDDKSRFYFVHSFFADVTNKDHMLASTTHGLDFASVIRSANVMGAQFHPEKSHGFGMKLIRNFLGLSRC